MDVNNLVSESISLKTESRKSLLTLKYISDFDETIFFSISISFDVLYISKSNGEIKVSYFQGRPSLKSYLNLVFLGIK